MTVYALAQLSIHDRRRYTRYATEFATSLDGFDGRLLVADETPEIIEGDWQLDKIVLIEFDDVDEFHRWGTSDAYRTIATDRIAATRGTILLMHGFATDDRPAT